MPGSGLPGGEETKKTSPDSIQAAGKNGILIVVQHEKTRQPELLLNSCLLLRRKAHGIWNVTS